MRTELSSNQLEQLVQSKDRKNPYTDSSVELEIGQDRPMAIRSFVVGLSSRLMMRSIRVDGDTVDFSLVMRQIVLDKHPQ